MPTLGPDSDENGHRVGIQIGVFGYADGKFDLTKCVEQRRRPGGKFVRILHNDAKSDRIGPGISPFRYATGGPIGGPENHVDLVSEHFAFEIAGNTCHRDRSFVSGSREEISEFLLLTRTEAPWIDPLLELPQLTFGVSSPGVGGVDLLR